MKKVLVVDWLDTYGGAERVIKSLCTTFSFDKYYTLTNVMNKEDLDKIFNHKKVSIEQTKLRWLGKSFRIVFPFFNYFLKTIKVDPSADIIISSSHAVAKGIRKSNKKQIHISYFQARNQKYIWEDKDLYFGKKARIFSRLITKLRKIDVSNAQKPDHIICNSIFVKKWVKKTYKRDSVVIYPPVDISRFPLQQIKSDYYVAVGRLEPYKRFDLVVEAFNVNKKPLIIVGDGSELKNLKKMANQNITFTGFLESKGVYKYISQAKAFVHAGIEDFGIAPIEAQSCGTPVIAYGNGGILETIIEGETGVFFHDMKEESIRNAVEKFEKMEFKPHHIRNNAQRFSIAHFEEKMNKFIEDKTLSLS